MCTFACVSYDAQQAAAAATAHMVFRVSNAVAPVCLPSPSRLAAVCPVASAAGLNTGGKHRCLDNCGGLVNRVTQVQQQVPAADGYRCMQADKRRGQHSQCFIVCGSTAAASSTKSLRWLQKQKGLEGRHIHAAAERR